jgi:hypothetical protein
MIEEIALEEKERRFNEAPDRLQRAEQPQTTIERMVP